MALPEPISANLPAPTASAVRGTSPLTLPQCLPEQRIFGASFGPCFAHHDTPASTARRTAHSKGCRSHGCHCSRLSKSNSRQSRPHTQARMGAS